MHHFFVEKNEITGEEIRLYGENFHHLKNVLRGEIGEEIIISTGEDADYHCKIRSYTEDCAVLSISFLEALHELETKLILLQALPKAEKKRGRWQAIAEAAAKQSKRSRIPSVFPVCSWKEAFSAVEKADLKLLPYENEKGVRFTKEQLIKVEELAGKKGSSIAVAIGPEGGFSKEEVERARAEGFLPVSLGKRILRTETAAIAVLSLLMMHLEFGSG